MSSSIPTKTDCGKNTLDLDFRKNTSLSVGFMDTEQASRLICLHFPWEQSYTHKIFKGLFEILLSKVVREKSPELRNFFSFKVKASYDNRGVF